MAISAAALACLGGSVFGQSPTVPPPPTTPATTQWTPFQQAPTTPSVPVGTLPTVTVAPIPTLPGLVPKTVTFQKGAGESSPSLPPLGVPAIPTALVKPPQAEEPAKKDDPAAKKEVPMVTEGRQPELTKGTLPSRQNVFRLTSDADLNSRIQQELGNRKDAFPAPAPLSTEPLVYRPKTETYPAMKSLLEPNYVAHRRLYFEDMNTERAGWDMGALQPFISAGYFVKDVTFLPHKWASGCWKNRFDSSYGKCEPGSPTPMYLYPPGFTLCGVTFQTTTVLALAFIIP